MNSRNDIDDNEAITMSEEEKSHPSSRFNSDGKRQRFRSFYDHPRYNSPFTETTAEIGHKDYVRTCDMSTEDQLKCPHENSNDSLRSSDWKKQTGSTMKSTILQGSLRNSSMRKPKKTLAEYNAKLAVKAKDVNFKE